MTLPNRSAFTPPLPLVEKPALNEVRSAWVESRSGIKSLEPEWRALIKGTAHRSPFLRPEWTTSTLEAFLPNAQPAILVTRENSQLSSILPLVRSNTCFGRLPLRTLRSISSIHSIRSDLVGGDSQSEAATEQTWAALKHESWWNALRLDDVPENGAFHRILRLAKRDGFLTAVWRTRLCPFLPISSSGDPQSNCPKRYKSFRNRLKGKLEKLAAHGPVSFEIHQNATPEVIAEFFELEAGGWKGQAGSAIKSRDTTRRFYTDMITHGAAHGYLRMYSMKINGKPVAMHLGLLDDDVYYTPKVAYDEGYREFSLGHILMRHVVHDLPGTGSSRFEFLGPNALWKSVWTTNLLRHDNCYIFRPNLAGRIGYTTISQIASRLRKLRHRFKGDPQIIR
jgi:CelD/BcsL family acetyltransferase involved in cellulose biosynthesis